MTDNNYVHRADVSYARTIQVKDYEPAVATVKFSIGYEEGADVAGLARSQLDMAKTLVHEALSKAPGYSKDAAPVAEAPKETAAAKKKRLAAEKKVKEAATDEVPGDEVPEEPTPEQTAKAAEKRAKEAKAAADEIPGDDPAPKATADDIPGDDPAPAKEETKAGADEIPGDEAPLEDWEKLGEDDEFMTAPELQDFINNLVGTRALAVPEVKAVLGTFNAVRTADTKESERPAVKAALQAAADAKAK
jgi:hypothetical protein